MSFKKKWVQRAPFKDRDSYTYSKIIGVVDLVGIDHVSIGTGFDGGGGVDGCNDVSETGNITLELVKRGYMEEQIRKMGGGNLIRVFGEVECLRSQAK